jgi:hypothetical protein
MVATICGAELDAMTHGAVLGAMISGVEVGATLAPGGC